MGNEVSDSITFIGLPDKLKSECGFELSKKSKEAVKLLRESISKIGMEGGFVFKEGTTKEEEKVNQIKDAFRNALTPEEQVKFDEKEERLEKVA
jgi:hypothetical protein